MTTSEDRTIVNNHDKTVIDGASMRTSHTIRTEGVGSDATPMDYQQIIIKGKTYVAKECLSDDSGEAQVYLVECDGQEYVLKVYYPNIHIKKNLMKVILNMQFEVVVRLYDFGKTYVDGKYRYYELMEYLQGGAMNGYTVNGDLTKFRRIALQAAAALAYCHNNGIIHKDIKPANLFFRDKEQTQVVLADFGISSLMKKGDANLRTTQARTPIYAAPEMYNDVIDGEVEITPAADYYSLGMTLLAIWTGAKPLNTNERNMMKRKSEGRLPGIQDVPERVRMVVQGLTAVNPESRWAYQEVEKWFEGETPKVDIASPWLRYKSFVVDPERNLVADNVHELIPMLLENERIARGYLYGGRIVNWLELSGNTKLSTAVKDIIRHRYPLDQQAGLMASIYAMEPTYPYKDIHGNLCDDMRSVVISMMKYAEEYALVLRNPNDSLWLYVESHTKCDVTRMRSYFSATGDNSVAVTRCIYELDGELSFLPNHPSGTLKEIVNAFGSGMLDEDAWRSLCDGRLLSWMYVHAEPMACESLRILTENQPYSRQLAYKVLYNIDRDAAYDLKEADTPAKVGEMMCEQMKEWQSLDEAAFEEAIAEYKDKDGRFHYFAQLHGWYMQVAELDRCFDMQSEENRERLGAYDLRTAAYRACRILGATPSYMLRTGDELKNGRAIPSKYRSAIRTELRQGYFSQWLAVFYHEDPAERFSEEYSYERMLVKWIEVIGDFDAQHTYHKRYLNACEANKAKYEEVRSAFAVSKRREIIWSVCFGLLCAIWFYFLYKYGISNRPWLLSHLMVAVGAPLGGAVALFVGLRLFFRGYGFIMLCFLGLLSGLTAGIPMFVLKLSGGLSDTAFNIVITLLSMGYIVAGYLTNYHTESKEDKQLFNEVLDADIKSSLIEPLYYTFKTKSYHFKGTKFRLLDGVRDRLRALTEERFFHHLCWCLLFLCLIVELVAYHPLLLDMPLPDLNFFEVSSSNINQIVQ